jgi:hypothetical protein
MQPGGVAYWDTPYFANAMYGGGEWLSVRNGAWGDGIAYFQNAQFDGNGYPKYLNSGETLRAILYGLHVDEARANLARGHVVLTWKGDADVRLSGGGDYLASESSGAESGSLVNGRRVYRYTTSQLQWLTVEAINAASPITEIRVWLADPADAANTSLEDRLFHPTFLARLHDERWGYARFMDWVDTNANPQQDWADRRLPSHAFMTGVLNTRPPAVGFDGNRGTGVAYEHVVAACNEAGLDLWINVPHLASPDFVDRLARLIRYGSDGVDPYNAPQANPAFAPLRADLKVYVEYSNEIWSWGNAFAQGQWAYDEATAINITKEQFNARRFCDVWSTFQRVLGGTERLVRVAAVFTANAGYTTPFLDEIKVYGPTLNPPVEPDVLAPTTYFGDGIQDHVLAQPWLDGVTNTDPYWTSVQAETDINLAFDEWTRRMLSGAAQEGAGPDATGIGGGFDEWLHQAALTTFSTPKPLVAYEGGPSIYTDQIENMDPVKGPMVTQFMAAMNRHPRMAEVYRIHLNMAHSHGLTSHAPFVLVSSWGKYGEWGHLEYLDQDPATAVKYQFLRDWIAEVSNLNSVDNAVGARPTFTTASDLQAALVGMAYSQDIATSASTVEVVGSVMQPGLTVAAVPGNPAALRVSGTPSTDLPSYVYARARSSSGDVAFRTFTLRAFGGPGALVDVDLTGTDPALHLPWTATYSTAANVTWSGFGKGAGISAESGAGLVWSVNAPADEAQATLALAITDGEYWSATVTPSSGTLDLRGAVMRFTVRRIDYHAPRIYAVMTSVGGFTDGAEVFTSPHNADTADMEYVVTLPTTAAYAALGATELRIYGYSGQYGGHKTSITAFKLRAAP